MRSESELLACDPVGAAAPGELVYLYGIVAADCELDADSLRLAEASRPLTRLGGGRLAAIGASVPAQEFEEDVLRERLRDLAWVEAAAVEHSSVLDRLHRLTTVLPLRMCTVYRDRSRVRELLAEQEEELLEALERLRGRSEWGVRVLASVAPQDTMAAAPHPDAYEAAPRPPAPAPGAGTSYMRSLLAEREREQRRAREQSAACALIHERLGGAADEALLHAGAGASGGDRDRQLQNGIYLVADAALDDFAAALALAARDAAQAGLELVHSGPWPPYNFTGDYERAGGDSVPGAER